MRLEKFQRETVRAAAAALRNRSGSRRFLIADEVGLGKTVTAKEIARELAKHRRKPLNIVYLCPNLEIAAQNLTKLTALEPDWQRPEDRLSLVVGAGSAEGSPRFRVFCYTPDTSLPGWRGNNRTGRAPERALVASLLARTAPRAWLRVRSVERQREVDGFGAWFPDLPPEPRHLREPFAQALAEVLETKIEALEERLAVWLASNGFDIAELILRSRSALALVALRDPAYKPDLLILDEFHRYADLIIYQPPGKLDERARERRHVHELLAEALLGASRSAPAVLLLSATPYRLRSVDRKALPGGRYGHFVDVVRFLYGSKGQDAEAIGKILAEHHEALGARDERDQALARVAETKRAVEALLRPVIARTERATTIPGELFKRLDQPAHVEARDLKLFRHLAKATQLGAAKLSGWVQPLWSSVPYPAELLHDYKICRGLTRALPSVTIISEGGNPAHPQLRSLVRGEQEHPPILRPEVLSLPWLAPTRPWWPLGGSWADAVARGERAGKALIFSRYTGTPPAVTAWLSAEVDRTSARQSKAKGKFAAQAYLRPDKARPWSIAALFMPWPSLSTLIDMEAAPASSLSDARKAARRALRKRLKAADDVKLGRRDGPSRKPWQIVFALEAQLGGRTMTERAMRRVLNRQRIDAWELADSGAAVTTKEIRILADWLLDAPGPVIARLLARHEQNVSSDAKLLERAFRFSWRQLRQYLGQRYFAAAILGSRGKSRKEGGYPEALRRAVAEGGLEATLDEHLAVSTLIGDLAPIEVLEASVLGRPGRVRRRTTRARGRARVHVAMPFVGAERRGGGKSDKLRSDAIRRAFNGPFWPNVLVTTSIGQEGLDFHVWCDRIVHWDLPRDPVDFEQREGRISRYASICVRRALAAVHPDALAQPGKSPFAAILGAAQAMEVEGLGLERWWSPPAHLPASVTFELPFSREGKRLNDLRDDLVRYRLALGQPEPGRFGAMLEHFGVSSGEARKLALNLSPATPAGPSQDRVRFAKDDSDARMSVPIGIVEAQLRIEPLRAVSEVEQKDGGWPDT